MNNFSNFFKFISSKIDEIVLLHLKKFISNLNFKLLVSLK